MAYQHMEVISMTAVLTKCQLQRSSAKKRFHFFTKYHVNLRGLFKAKAIFVENSSDTFQPISGEK